METNSTQSDASTRSSAFPWGCALGHCESDAFEKRHVLLPTMAGGLLVEFSVDMQTEAIEALETIVLSMIDQLPTKLMKLHVVDFSIRKKFQNLSQLAPLRQYRLYGSENAATQALTDLEALARFRHHELLSDTCTTISQFNRQVKGKEAYQIALINLDDFPLHSKDEIRLASLLEAAFDAGIFVIGFVTKDTSVEVDQEQSERWSNSRNLFEKLYPRITFIKNEKGGQVEMNGHSATQKLLQLIHDNGLHISSGGIDLQAICQRQKDKHAQTTANFKDFLSVLVGDTLDGRSEISFSLGEKSDCNSALILGLSGSGKTTFLNNLIVGIAEQYSSDEVRLFLMDYKNGVEFQVFSEHPNCEKIFLDNKDREAAVEMLTSLVSVMDERARIFRQHEVKDIDSYKNKQIGAMPRLILIVDEVQCLLSNDNFGRRFSTQLLDVVKRGRSFGIHLILSTQTLINTNVERDLMSQITLRIAYKLNNDTDCEKILCSGNLIPRNLNKFEFIYNADSGNKEANVRGVCLPPPQILERIAVARQNRGESLCIKPILVESEAASDPSVNGQQSPVDSQARESKDSTVGTSPAPSSSSFQSETDQDRDQRNARQMALVNAIKSRL